MKNKVLFLGLTFVLLGSLMAASCAKPTPETTTPTPAPAPAEVIELKLPSSSPPTGAMSESLIEWAKKLEERTQGRVKITFYWGGTLGGGVMDTWRYLQEGLSDISQIVGGHFPADFPLTGFSDLPFVTPSGRPTPYLNTIFDKYLAKEHTQKVLWPVWLASLHFFTNPKPIRTLEDLKGMEIGCPPGKVAEETLKALGVTPATFPPPEVYSALERGMIDGQYSTIGMLMSLKHHEVLKHATICYVNCGIAAVMMNNDTWNKLPPDIQQIFDELSPWVQELTHESSNAEEEAALAMFKEQGKTVIYLSPEERAKFMAATEPVVDNWMKEMDARGLPGTALVEEARRLNAELEKK